MLRRDIFEGLTLVGILAFIALVSYAAATSERSPERFAKYCAPMYAQAYTHTDSLIVGAMTVHGSNTTCFYMLQEMKGDSHYKVP